MKKDNDDGDNGDVSVVVIVFVITVFAAAAFQTLGSLIVLSLYLLSAVLPPE